ncbi:CheR family methyltransferase [Pararobbsia silviterrae]|uniref:Chemotaxis protein methyltransferase n=1 Tax=Pararobbsia silviterrae TaxID=1792498 RepID=A0A494Y1K9_9BURK|nr:CheR family methyltransferase [Pararobbsia silviterrae]RKP56587.1 methyltransferase domain-containing protein [Pararobbsia silviterrae]
MTVQLTDKEFSRFREFIHNSAGIHLSPSKKNLICSRLAKRLNHFGYANYTQYLDLIGGRDGGGEVQIAIDLLTTNETFFFRESKHFEQLRLLAGAVRASARSEPVRVWSAACSSGEEPYSIAMVLAETLGEKPWEVVGTDISTRVLARARRGHYPVERAQHVPAAFLERYCLKGIGQYDGTLLVSKPLRQRVRFVHANLNVPLPDLGQFDCVFLRNVMIYFNNDTKRSVVARVLERLRPGGLFCIGHSETLNEINTDVVQVMPSIYRKP